MQRKTRLQIECLLLFFIIPPMLYLVRHHIAFRIFFVLAAATFLCSILLFKDPDFDRLTLWRWHHFGKNVKSILLFFLPTALLLAFITWIFLPDKFLAFPRARPLIWVILMILYPLLLAWPQELIFRCFFFQRYGSLFTSSRQLVFMNAISFSLSHLFYGNFVAIVLSFIGGYLFAWRYHVTKSLPFVSLEHGIWGNYLFTIGIGWYFYSGAIK
jgi:membrane protease YdiL (CAAX protease family)